MNALLSQLQVFWQARLPREQRILLFGGVALVVVLWLALVILPLQNRVQRLETELPQLRETNASLQSMAHEAAQLSAGPTATALPMAEREGALRRSLARAALGDLHTIDVTVQDSAHMRVHCDDTDYGQWLAWLHSTREELGASIDSVTVTARPPNGITGRVRADVVFGFASGAMP